MEGRPQRACGVSGVRGVWCEQAHTYRGAREWGDGRKRWRLSLVCSGQPCPGRKRKSGLEKKKKKETRQKIILSEASGESGEKQQKK